MNLCRFTALGFTLFEDYLTQLEIDPKTTFNDSLLSNTQYSSEIDDIEVIKHKFKSRFEAARYINTLINDAYVADVESDIYFWAWLTAFYFDVVCPSDSQGNRKVRERSAYIPEPNNYKRYYRHLLLGPYLIFRAHKTNPEIAMALLCKPVHIITDIEAQIAATPSLVTNPAVVELTTRLYYDPKTKTAKPGAGGKGPGSPRRLVTVLGQFELTWDLFAATPIELEKLLPNEFQRFLQ